MQDFVQAEPGQDIEPLGGCGLWSERAGRDDAGIQQDPSAQQVSTIVLLGAGNREPEQVGRSRSHPVRQVGEYVPRPARRADSNEERAKGARPARDGRGRAVVGDSECGSARAIEGRGRAIAPDQGGDGAKRLNVCRGGEQSSGGPERRHAPLCRPRLQTPPSPRRGYSQMSPDQALGIMIVPAERHESSLCVMAEPTVATGPGAAEPPRVHRCPRTDAEIL